MATADEISWYPSLKAPRGTEWVKPLTEHLKKNFSAAEADSHKTVIQDLQKQCKEIRGWKDKDATPDKIEAVLLPYASRVMLIAQRFAGFKGIFKWSETLVPGEKTSLSPYMECLSTVFSIGLLYMRQAASVSVTDSEGIKTSYRLYLTAAGVFQFLHSGCDEIWGRIPADDRGTDLSAEGIEFYAHLCITEGVRRGYLKAVKEPATAGKHSLLTKLAGEAVTKYGETVDKFKAIQAKKPDADSQILGYLYVCKDLQTARGLCHMAEEALIAEEIGLQVSLLNQAQQRASNVHTAHAAGNLFLANYSYVVAAQREKAASENNKIYGQPVSKEQAVVPSLGKDFVKAIAFEAGPAKILNPQQEVWGATGPAERGFEALVPAHIESDVESWKQELLLMVRRTERQLQEAHSGAVSSHESQTIMSGYDSSVSRSLPPQLRAKISRYQAEAKSAGNCYSFLKDTSAATLARCEQAFAAIADASSAMDKDFEQEKCVRTEYGAALPVSGALMDDLQEIRGSLSEINTKLARNKSVAEAIGGTLDGAKDLLDRLDVSLEEVDAALSGSEGSSADARAVQIIAEVQHLYQQVQDAKSLQQISYDELRQGPDTAALTKLLLTLEHPVDRSNAMEESAAPFVTMQEELLASAKDTAALWSTIRRRLEELQRELSRGLPLGATAERVAGRLQDACTHYEVELRDKLVTAHSDSHQLADTVDRIRTRVAEFIATRTTDREGRMQEAEVAKQMQEKACQLQAATAEAERQMEDTRRIEEELSKKKEEQERQRQHMLMLQQQRLDEVRRAEEHQQRLKQEQARQQQLQQQQALRAAQEQQRQQQLQQQQLLAQQRQQELQRLQQERAQEEEKVRQAAQQQQILLQQRAQQQQQQQQAALQQQQQQQAAQQAAQTAAQQQHQAALQQQQQAHAQAAQQAAGQQAAQAAAQQQQQQQAALQQQQQQQQAAQVAAQQATQQQQLLQQQMQQMQVQPTAVPLTMQPAAHPHYPHPPLGNVAPAPLHASPVAAVPAMWPTAEQPPPPPPPPQEALFHMDPNQPPPPPPPPPAEAPDMLHFS